MQPFVTSESDAFSGKRFLNSASSNHLRHKSCEHGPSCFYPLPSIPPCHVVDKVEKYEHGLVDVAPLPTIPHHVVSMKVEKVVFLYYSKHYTSKRCAPLLFQTLLLTFEKMYS